jgi:hypothetical protein
MTLEEEIKFYMDAKQKAVTTGNGKEFEARMNLLFLEGQMTMNAYQILRQIFGYTPVKIPTTPVKVTRSSTTC